MTVEIKKLKLLIKQISKVSRSSGKKVLSRIKYPLKF